MNHYESLLITINHYESLWITMNHYGTGGESPPFHAKKSHGTAFGETFLQIAPGPRPTSPRPPSKHWRRDGQRCRFRQQKWWLNPPKKGDLNIQKIYLLYGNGSKPIPTSNNWMNHLKTTSFTSYDLGCHPGTRRLIHILTYSHESYWTNVAMENGDLLIYPWNWWLSQVLPEGTFILYP